MYPGARAVQLRQLALVPTRIHHLPYIPVRVLGLPRSEKKEGPLSLDKGVLPDRIVAVDQIKLLSANLCSEHIECGPHIPQ
jgi:hypothetical protein